MTVKPSAPSLLKLSALSLALGLGGVALADDARAPVRAPVASATAADSDGKTLFIDNCAKCHAQDGSGDTKMGEKFRNDGKNMPDLRVSELDRAATHRAIAEGIPKTPMKGYAKKLSEAELEALTTYSLSLRGDRPAD